MWLLQLGVELARLLQLGVVPVWMRAHFVQNLCGCSSMVLNVPGCSSLVLNVYCLRAHLCSKPVWLLKPSVEPVLLLQLGGEPVWLLQPGVEPAWLACTPLVKTCVAAPAWC